MAAAVFFLGETLDVQYSTYPWNLRKRRVEAVEVEDVGAEITLDGGDAAGALAAHGADLGAVVGVEVVLPLVGPLPAEGKCILSPN